MADPVVSMTSSARTHASAVAGKDRGSSRRVRPASRACRAAAPTVASSCSRRARTDGSVPGKVRSSRTARRYRPEPPTRDRMPTWQQHVVDNQSRHALVFGDARRFGHVPDVQQMMGTPAAFGCWQFGRTDVEAPIQLHRVGVHDLALERASAMSSASDDLPTAVGPTTARGGRSSSPHQHRVSVRDMMPSRRTLAVTVALPESAP